MDDSFAKHDRVFLEKLRLATTTLLDLAEDPGVVNGVLESELTLFLDRVDRALLLPADAAEG